MNMGIIFFQQQIFVEVIFLSKFSLVASIHPSKKNKPGQKWKRGKKISRDMYHRKKTTGISAIKSFPI
jgi:hypothetical protein